MPLTPDEPTETRLDLRGLKCPMPVLRTRKALAAAAAGAVLVVEATDPLARLDLANLVRETGDDLVEVFEGPGYVGFRIRKAPAPCA